MYSESYKGYFRARVLRASLTKTEKLMWQMLRGRQLEGYKFRRQHPIGPYVIDFYCARKQIAIELDGSIHEQNFIQQRDQERTRFLGARGIKVIRFWNADIRNKPQKVIEQILEVLFCPPSPLATSKTSP